VTKLVGIAGATSLTFRNTENMVIFWTSFKSDGQKNYLNISIFTIT